MAAGVICWQNASMDSPEMSLQVRHVPPDVHAILRKRAAAEGKSLQEYLLALLVGHARRPSVREVFARVEGRPGGGHFSFEETNEILRADRESR
jgi:plasmid stability protein